MLGMLLHVGILLAMLLIERRSFFRLAPGRAAAFWYLLGIPLMLIEAIVSGAWIFFLLQSLVTTLFLLPPAYAAFWLARKRSSVLLPFLAFAVLACWMMLLAGLMLAHTPFVFGNPWKS